MANKVFKLTGNALFASLSCGYHSIHARCRRQLNYFVRQLDATENFRRSDMALPISLNKVVEEIDHSIEGCGAYINRRTGEIVSGDLELIEDDEGLPAPMKKAATKLRTAAMSQDWLLLPEEFRCETEAMIERFCKECCSGTARRELLSHVRNGMSVGVLKARLADHQLAVC